MPRPVRAGFIGGPGNVVKPVAPARLSYPLLGLHHHIAQRGEGHIAAHFASQILIPFHARIEEFDQSEAKSPLAAQFLICPAISTPKTAITLASSLLEPTMTGMGC